jgi:hypothetical protein
MTFGILFWLFGVLLDVIIPLQTTRFDGKFGLYIVDQNTNWNIRWAGSMDQDGKLTATYETGEVKEFNADSGPVYSVIIPKSESSITITLNESPETITLLPRFGRPASEVSEIDSVYVLGDVHGNFHEVIKILQAVKLIDGELNWIGGKKHLVFDGDVMDRGPDPIRILWMIHDLEQQAKAVGGNVHLILGNHEIMVMSGDTRYISRKDTQLAAIHQVRFQEFLNPTSTYLGQWLATRPSILKIDALLFTHGGMITDYAGFDLSAYNDSVYRFINTSEFVFAGQDSIDVAKYDPSRWRDLRSFFYDPNNVFWFRGYVQYDTLEPYLDYIHEQFNTKTLIVGHTVVPAIESMYNGKLIATNLDVGGSEILLMVRKKRNRYDRFVIDLEGNKRILE